MTKLTRSQAKNIRHAYCEEHSPVSELKKKYKVSQAVIYEVLNNQRFHDPDYQPIMRPRQILRQFGLLEISRLRSEGYSWVDVSRLIETETGQFVRADAIRTWFYDQDDVRAMARRMSS